MVTCYPCPVLIHYGVIVQILVCIDGEEETAGVWTDTDGQSMESVGGQESSPDENVIWKQTE